MAITTRYLVPNYDPNSEQQKQSMGAFINQLSDELRNEGITISTDEKTDLANGFVRVNISKGGTALPSTGLYLDLRLGMLSPRGQTVEMASSTMSNYGMPGFARHVPAQNQISNTTETFKDYIRSVFDFALAENKEPRQVAWSVYQKGYSPRNYPPSEQWGAEEYESPLFQGTGGVITRSSSSGQRNLMASTIRYVLPEGKTIQEYGQETMAKGRAGEPLGLPGYGLNEKMTGWIPMGTSYTKYRPKYGTSEEVFVDLPRGLSSFKSLTSTFGARNLADVPLVRDPTTGRWMKVKPSKPELGTGYRTGWTRSSMLLPTETEPRIVFSGNVAMVDQPDMPGAMYSSKGALDFVDEGLRAKGISRRSQRATIGESGDITYEFGVKTTADLKKIIENGLQFRDLEGQEMRPGPGQKTIASYNTPEGEQAYKNLYIGRRSYPVVLHKPTLHVPKYYEMTTEGNLFSNVPSYDQGGDNLLTTDALIKDLKEQYGEQVNIAQYSAIGSRGKEDPAAVYMTIPMERVNPVSAKSDAFKGYLAAQDYEFKFKMLGTKEDVPVDFVTQESKIPVRALMQSVGVMNMKTAQKFMGMFLPQGSDAEKTAVKKIQQDIKTQFTKPPADGIVRLDPRVWASTWEDITGERVTPDTLFSKMVDRIEAITNASQARAVKRQFGLGVLSEQWAFGGVYSKGGADALRQVFADFEGVNPDDFIKFERYSPPGSKKWADSVYRDAESQLYKMQYRVAGGKNISLQTGLSFVSEYVSQSGFINSKGIMSIIGNYPEAANALGLRGDTGNWAGVFSSKAYTEGEPAPNVAAAQALLPYISFQQELFRNTKVSLPAKHVVVTPEMGADLLTKLGTIKQLPTDEAQVQALREAITNLDPDLYNLERGTPFEEMYFYDPNSGTIAPPVDAIPGVEHYEEGAFEGRTTNYIAKNYIRLLEVMSQSAQSSAGGMVSQVRPVQESFFRTINRMAYPGSKRSKQFARNLTGITLPGQRGGRYQGMTALEAGNAYASDEYIIRMLSNGGFKTASEISSIMRYLNGSPEAYLPILSQRYPDVGDESMFIPLKLRSYKHLLKMGLPMPSGTGSKDLMYLSTNVSRMQAGDFDADPAKQIVLPINRMYDPVKKTLTDNWYMENKLASEFSNRFDMFHQDISSVPKYLKELFGQHGVVSSGESLDAARKNVADYISAVLGQSSFQSRMREPGTLPVASAQEEIIAGQGLQGGKGVSYIMRTELMDIASAVLGMGGRNPDILKSAYESSGLTYQAYLDRWKRMAGGFTALETMMNSYGLYNVSEAKGGGTDYRVSYKLTEQGMPVDLDRKSWVTAAGNVRAGQGLFRQMLDVVGSMPEDIMTNETLAWLTSAPGGAENVLSALSNPKVVPTGVGRTTTASRSNILKKMMASGQTGYNSPLYLALTYKAVKRAGQQFPEYVNNKDFTLPWINGDLMTIGDIMQTPEYRVWGVAENFFVRGQEAPSPQDLMLLEKMGGTRLAGEMAGIWSSMKKVTGGMAPVEQVATEFGERHREVFNIFRERNLKGKPVVHASELGALLEMNDDSLKKANWIGASNPEMIEAQYHLMFSAMGAPHLISSKDYPGTMFLSRSKVAAGEDIIGGTTYEEAYAKAHPELRHVGNAPSSLKFQIGALEMRGIPDFISLEKDSNGRENFVIRDTKSPSAEVAEKQGYEYNQAYAEIMAKKYRYRIQQMSYAYGLEQRANDPNFTNEEWLKLMKDWKVTSADEAMRFRDAASAGNFKLFIAPGRFVSGIKPEEYGQIEIPYGQAARTELETLSQKVSEDLLSQKFMGKVAAGIFRSLTKNTMLPGLTNYARTGEMPMPEDLLLFKTTAENAGIQMPPTRAAGGGRFSGLQGRRLRVGEGGPEDIVVNENGISVVPTHELPNRALSGYMGGRFQGGLRSIFGDEEAQSEPQAQPQAQPQSQAQQPVLMNEAAITAMNSYVDMLGKFMEFAQGGGFNMKIMGGGNPANELKTTTQVLTGFGALSNEGEIATFQKDISERVIGMFKRKGLYSQYMEGQGYEGGVNASQLLTLAQNVMPEAVQEMASSKTLQAKAAQVLRMGRPIESLFGLAQRKGGIRKAIAGLAMESEITQSQMQDLETMQLDEGDKRRMTLSEGMAAANLLKIQGTTAGKNPFFGVSEETVNKYNASLAKANDAALKWADAHEKGAGEQQAFTAAVRANREFAVENLRREVETRKAKAGVYTSSGAIMTPAERADAGITLEQEELNEKLAGVQQAQAALGKAETQVGKPVPRLGQAQWQEKVGGAARRLFSGFGLMYLRSIYGLATTGLETGLQERLAYDQQMSAPFLGIGGQMPVTPLTEQQRILATQYGGAGGMAMMAAKNAFMANQQPLYQFATTGLAGVSTGGMVTWAAEELFGKERGAALKYGAIAGLSAMAVNQGMQIYGATQDVQGTAMNLAVRRARGENMLATGLAPAIAGGITGAGIGAVVGGGLPGAAIGFAGGAILGGLSNYQQIAAALSPEIRQQSDLLTALSERGSTPITSIVQQYGYGENMAPYFARLAAEIEASKKQNLGIGAEAWGAASAFQLRRGGALSESERYRFAQLAQGGFNPEAYGLAATQAMGMSVFRASQPMGAPTYTTQTITEKVPLNLPSQDILRYNPEAAWGVTFANALAPQEITRQVQVEVPAETAAAKYARAMASWAERRGGAELGGEQAQAIFGAVGQMGAIGMEEFGKRMRATVPMSQWRRQYNSLQDWQTENAMRYGQNLADLQATGWLTPYQQMAQNQVAGAALGLTTTAVPTAEEYRRSHPEANAAQIAQATLQAQEAGTRNNLVTQWRQQALSTVGILPTYAPNVTPLEIQQGMAQTNYAGNFGQQMLLGGMRPAVAQQMSSAMQNMPADVFRQYRGLFSMQPLQVGAFFNQNPQVAAQIMQQGYLPGMGGTQINPFNLGMTDVSAQTGRITGMAWGTTSLATPAMTAFYQQTQSLTQPQAAQAASWNIAGQIWGNNWRGRTDVSQGLISAMAQGGQFGGQAYQQMQSAQYQLASAGNQIAQLQLQAEYQPQFWALEDRSRNLGYRQQEFSFQQQWAQMGVQQENFQFQTGMQQRQMGLQRGWQQEDWRYQGQVRNLQWGWQQEDYSENLRFMTGRDRRLAERQMGRATTLHDLESEQIDKQKDRQKELWAMEDERFNQQVSYQQKLFDMQEDNLRMQEQFYQERKALEQEQVELNREYWQKQHDLSMQAAQASAGYAAEQVKIAQAMMEFNQYSETATAEGNLMNEETLAGLAAVLSQIDPTFASYVENMGIVTPLMDEFVTSVKDLITALGGTPGGGDGGGGGGGSYTCGVCGATFDTEEQLTSHERATGHRNPRAFGGRVQPGETYLVGERGIEVFQPDVSGVIKPRDPWGTTFTTDYAGNSGGGETKLIHLQVFVGDERLIDRVVEAVDQKVKD